ncbi:MAG TPA: hypothetical protein VH575_28545 [Gemmataceae bacterium]|jgi:hypothetical protein
MTRAKSWRWGYAVCLTAVLIGSALGCHPAGDSANTGSTPSTSKPDKQPDNKDKPAKQPKPEVG